MVLTGDVVSDKGHKEEDDPRVRSCGEFRLRMGICKRLVDGAEAVVRVIVRVVVVKKMMGPQQRA